MYNRYIPNEGRYTRVIEEDAPPPPSEPVYQRIQEEPASPPPSGGRSGSSSGTDPLASLLGGLFSGKKQAGKTGLFEKLKLDDIDTGDILLLLILLFLFRDGDDIELVIALGLVLLLGLGDHDSPTA